MKFEDDSQNLKVRLRIIQMLVIMMIMALGVRLYYLQIVKGAYYAERAENQRIRLLPIPAPRGVIMDRNGNVLVDSSPIYNVILSREDLKDKDFQTGDIVGQEGLEKVYDDYLRGRDGYRKVIVDSRGHIQSEIERVEPQPGPDMVTTIESDLQDAAEERLRKSPHGRGVVI